MAAPSISQINSRAQMGWRYSNSGGPHTVEKTTVPVSPERLSAEQKSGTKSRKSGRQPHAESGTRKGLAVCFCWDSPGADARDLEPLRSTAASSTFQVRADGRGLLSAH